MNIDPVRIGAIVAKVMEVGGDSEAGREERARLAFEEAILYAIEIGGVRADILWAIATYETPKMRAFREREEGRQKRAEARAQAAYLAELRAAPTFDFKQQELSLAGGGREAPAEAPLARRKRPKLARAEAAKISLER